MVTTFILAFLGPLSIFIGLFIFTNAFITFLLFHGLVCVGIPIIDLYIIKKQNYSSIVKSLGLLSNKNSTKAGVYSGIIFFTVLILFFNIFNENIIKVAEIQLLLNSWNIKKNHIYILLFVMIFANSVLEEIYWRGYIFKRLKTHFNIIYVIILSSLFYGSYHFLTTANIFSIQIGIIFTVAIFLTGIFWGAIREIFGSLYTVIISHFFADLAIMTIYLVYIH
ncbi:MAG: type II CAAX endopeptidase family protein [Anaerolineae bacterium]|nr:type II CAAX endopeptidase family protein [Anaerolineae bacterium]